MSQPHSPAERHRADEFSGEALMDRFGQAWRNGPPPRIDEFLAAVPAGGARRRLLEELIMLDLECRWRNRASVGQPWLLEDYLAQYGELGSLQQLSTELIS